MGAQRRPRARPIRPGIGLAPPAQARPAPPQQRTTPAAGHRRDRGRRAGCRWLRPQLAGHRPAGIRRGARAPRDDLGGSVGGPRPRHRDLARPAARRDRQDGAELAGAPSDGRAAGIDAGARAAPGGARRTQDRVDGAAGNRPQAEPGSPGHGPRRGGAAGRRAGSAAVARHGCGGARGTARAPAAAARRPAAGTAGARGGRGERGAHAAARGRGTNDTDRRRRAARDGHR